MNTCFNASEISFCSQSEFSDPVGLGLLARPAADEVVEAVAELGEEAAGEGEGDEDPEEDDEAEGEPVEELGAVVGVDRVKAEGGVELDRVVDVHHPLGADHFERKGGKMGFSFGTCTFSRLDCRKGFIAGKLL